MDEKKQNVSQTNLPEGNTLNEQSSTISSKSRKLNPWFIIIFSSILLFIATYLDGFGFSAHVFGTYIAKLIGYSICIGVPTFVITKIAKKSMKTALNIFTWIFFGASLIAFLVVITQPEIDKETLSKLLNTKSNQIQSNLPQGRRTTPEEIIEYWDPILSLEQRKYRIYIDSISEFLGSLGEESTINSIATLERNIEKLSDVIDRNRQTIKNHVPIWQNYGAELESTIMVMTNLIQFRNIWRSYIENVTFVYTYDSEIICNLISYLSFLKSNRLKYYFINGEIQSDDNDFIQELSSKISKVKSLDEIEIQQKRNQVILDYAKALDIAKTNK